MAKKKKTVLEEITGSGYEGIDLTWRSGYHSKKTAKKYTDSGSNKKSIGGTLKYLASKIGSDFTKTLEGTADFTAKYIMQPLAKLTSKAVNNKPGKVIFGEEASNYKNNPLYQLSSDMLKDDVGKTLDNQANKKLENKSYVDKNHLATQVASGVGQVAGYITGGKAMPGKLPAKIAPVGKSVTNIAKAPTATNKLIQKAGSLISQPTTKSMFTSVAGNSYTRAIKEGASENDAALYGILSGAKESGIELATGGLSKWFGKGATDDVVKNLTKKYLKNKIAQKSTEFGIKAVGEGLEEVAASLAEPFIKQVYTKKLDFSEYDNLANDFIVGAAVSGVLQGGQISVEKAQKGLTKGTSEKPTKTSVEDLVNNIKEQKAQPKLLSQQDIKSMSEKSNIREVNEQIHTKAEELAKIESSEPKTKTEELMKENNIKDINKQLEELQTTAQTLEGNNIAPIRNDINLENSGNSLEVNPIQKAMESNSLQQNMQNDVNPATSVIETADRYMDVNDPVVQEKVVEPLSKIALERNMKIEFDDSIEGNGLIEYANGEKNIKLNPNSDRALEFTVIHELTHDLEGSQEYTDLKNFVINYDNSQSGYVQARADLERIYKNHYDSNGLDFSQVDIDGEATADILGKMLGNQDFINRLSTEKPTLFQKILNWIKDKIELSKSSNKEQTKFLQEAKAKFEKAYRENTTHKDGTMFSASLSSEVFSNQVDQVIDGTFPERDTLTVTNATPKVLLDAGLNNQPISMAQTKLKTIMKDESQKGGHGLDAETIKQIPKQIANPVRISKSATRSDSLVIETTLKDKNGKTIITSIKVDGEGRIGDVRFKSNILTSAYGKGNINNFNEKAKKEDRIIYEKETQKKVDRGRVQFPTRTNLSNNIIAPKQKNVKNSINLNGEVYKTKEIENIVSDYVSGYIEDQSLNIEVLDIAINGSRNRGDFNKDSDLDIVLEYKGKDKEDAVFNVLNENNLDISGVVVDINPIKAEKTGTISEYLETSKEYDREKLKNAEKSKYSVSDNSSYMMAHRPTGVSYGYDLDSAVDNTIYTNPEWYGQDGTGFRECVDVIRKIKGKPDADVVIYRATPGDSINNGDWITLSKSYAETHLDSHLEGKGNLLEKIVKAKDIQWAGDVLEEFGYYPNGKVEFSIAENNLWEKRLNELYDVNKDKETTILKDLPKAPIKKTATQSKIAAKYDNRKKSPLKIKAKENYDSFIRSWVNRGAYIDELAKKTNNPQLSSSHDKMLSAEAEGQYVIGTAQTDNTGVPIGKSIMEIWKPVEDADLTIEFSDYILHKHNIDRMRENKPIWGKDYTAEMSKGFVQDYEMNHPEFKEWSKEVTSFYKNQLNNMKEAGLASDETQKILEDMYDNYVKIIRLDSSDVAPFSTMNGKLKVGNPIKKATGGNKEILPLKDTMAQSAIQSKKAIRRNMMAHDLIRSLDKSPIDMEYKSTYEGEYGTLDSYVKSNESGTYTFTAFVEGKPVTYEIDKGLYESLDTSKKQSLVQSIDDSKITKPLQKMTAYHRAVLTVDNPLFTVTNFFKDIFDAPLNSKYASKFAKNYVRAINEMKNKSELWELYKANGGEGTTYFDYNKGLGKLAPKNKALKVAQLPVKAIEAVNEAIEQAPRFAEFISTIEAGGSIEQAMHNSAEITTNFKRGGDMAKAINRNGATFFNASIQGLSKLFRNFSGQNGFKGYANILIKATMLGVVPSVVNHLMYDDDDDYKKLTKDTKDRFYLLKYDKEKFVKIPKGRMLSLFGAIARRTLETKEEGMKAYDGLLGLISTQIAPNNPLENNVISPLSGAMNNTNWFGGDIVPSRLQKQLPKNQFDESTDALSKKIGEIFNISPMKVNYVLDQYLGGIGDVVLPMMTKQAEDNPLLSKFTTDAVLKGKTSQEFYSLMEEMEKKANDVKPTPKDVLQLKYLNKINSLTMDLYKEKRDIQLSDLNDKDKKAKVRSIQKLINATLEKGIEGYDKVKLGTDYSEIGGIPFHTNHKGEWVASNDRDIKKEKKAKKIGMDMNLFYHYSNEMSKVRSNKKLESKQKTTKVIDMLLNSDMSNDEIAVLYTKYNPYSEEKIKAITDSGIDMRVNLDLYKRIKNLTLKVKQLEEVKRKKYLDKLLKLRD